jgi:TIR domain
VLPVLLFYFLQRQMTRHSGQSAPEPSPYPIVTPHPIGPPSIQLSDGQRAASERQAGQRAVFDVFISYPHQDKTVADAACAKLEAEGIRCWIAPRDIVHGMDWGEAIVDAINGAKVMVLIFSGHANASPQIKREVERAVNRGIAIVPVRVENVTPTKSLEYFISTAHWLDAITPPLERHLKQLAVSVKTLMRMAPPGQESAQTTA